MQPDESIPDAVKEIARLLVEHVPQLNRADGKRVRFCVKCKGVVDK
jgi:hypothetical protein